MEGNLLNIDQMIYEGGGKETRHEGMTTGIRDGS